MVSTVRLFYMAVWRDWLSLKRYKLNFVFEILTSTLFGFGMPGKMPKPKINPIPQSSALTIHAPWRPPGKL